MTRTKPVKSTDEKKEASEGLASHTAECGEQGVVPQENPHIERGDATVGIVVAHVGITQERQRGRLESHDGRADTTLARPI